MREVTIDVRGWPLRILEGGDGPAVLFLHGAGGLSWSPLLDRLSARWRVLAPEHPGFGRLPLPDWLMSVGDLAFFYLDALKALDLTKVHLVGLSLGGWTAAEIAVRSTERLKSLTLLAPAGVAAEDEPFGDIFLWNAEETARRMFHDPRCVEQRLKEMAAADLDVVLQNRAATARLAWSPRLENPQLRHWLHRVDVPTLLVWGEEDRIVPFACHRAFLAEIPGARLFALPQSGHGLQVERAAEVGERLDAFFREVGP